MRKKRKQAADNGGQASGGAGKFGYKPFAGLLVPKDDERPSHKEPLQPDKAEEPHAQNIDDDELAMAEAIAGTEPLVGRELVPKQVAAKPMLAEVDDSVLVMRELDELVHGSVPFDFSDTEEYIEASVKGLERRIVRRLRQGEYSIQEHLDLHGYNRREARQQVGAFVERAHAEGKRCVLIVHGRGLGSKEGIPVLKQKLASWLTRGAIGRKVLAYTSARSFDGGTGAVYVLLRR